MVTVDRLLACMECGERCTRTEIMRRLDAGVASVQHVLNVCEAQGLLRCRSTGGRHVWWKPPFAQPVQARPFPVLQGYDAELHCKERLSVAARCAPPPGQRIYYGVGLP